MTANPPQRANFSQIFYPDGTCGVVDGLRDCMQPGVVLGTDPLEPEPKTATWFCSEHWAEFEAIYSVVEDRRPLVLFFQAVADIAAMKVVEDILHLENATDEDDESRDEKIERLESILDETEYAYIGINSIVYLYKGDDVIADLNTDDYSWKRSDENVNPIAAMNAIIDTIADKLKDKQ